LESRAETGFAVLAGALAIAATSASIRALDNMITTTVPLLGEYVFGLGTLYGGVEVAVYSGSELLGNFVVNRRLPVEARRKVLRGCSAGIAVICLLFAVSGSETAIILVVLAGTSTAIVAQNVVVSASSTPDRRRGERNLTIYAVGLSVGLVTGPVVESFLLTMGYSTVFVGFSVLGGVVFALSWRVKFPEVKEEVRRPGPKAWRGLNTAFLTASVFSIPLAAFTLLPIYTSESFHVPAAVAYSAFVPMYVVSLVVRLYMAARPLARLRLPILVNMLITVTVLAAMHFAPYFVVLLSLMAILGIPHGMAFTIALILVARTSEPEERKSANSYLSVYQGVLGMVVPVAIGYLSDLIGIHLSFLLLLIPAVGVSATCLLFYGRELDGAVVVGSLRQGMDRNQTVLP
jgi:predicted MFS family arabinose efflux permease